MPLRNNTLYSLDKYVIGHFSLAIKIMKNFQDLNKSLNKVKIPIKS